MFNRKNEGTQVSLSNESICLKKKHTGNPYEIKKGCVCDAEAKTLRIGSKVRNGNHSGHEGSSIFCKCCLCFFMCVAFVILFRN